MRLVALVILAFVTSLSAGCASPRATTLLPSAQHVSPHSSALQRRAVDLAIASAEQQYTEGLTALEQVADSDFREAQLERLLAQRNAARTQVLSPLVAQGNGEAMFRLASDLRDSSDPRDVERWFELVSLAARTGHPLAHDELTRWWWHQKGDGSITSVQRYRARALEHAEAAADAGYLRSLNRISVYIAGDVHQYPANLTLARAVMRLCAQGGCQECQERLALRSTYEFPESREERYFWLAVLSKQPSGLVGARMQVLRTNLGPEQRDRLQEKAGAWRPTAWSELRSQWRDLREAVLAHGASSVGVYGACSTSTPWCRADAAKLDQMLSSPLAGPAIGH